MATLPVFRTWVAGEIVTAAYMNTNIRDAGNFFVSWPVAELRQTIVQSVPNGGAALLFDVEDIDTDNGHSTSVNTSRYTAQTPGRFQFSGGVVFAANTAGRKGTWWLQNGSGVNGSSVVGPSAAALTLATSSRVRTMLLNGTTDYVELFGYQESGGALNTAVSTFDQPSMSVRMIGSV